MRLHPVKGGLILGVALAVGITLLPSHTYQVAQLNTMQASLALYRQVQKTKLSATSRELFYDTVNKRLDCYLQHGDYLDRLQICNRNYVNTIIEKARIQLKTMPAVGAFARELRMCPIVYAICMGECGDREKCIEMELRCIDYYLDLYWRGINLYANPDDWQIGGVSRPWMERLE